MRPPATPAATIGSARNRSGANVNLTQTAQTPQRGSLYGWHCEGCGCSIPEFEATRDSAAQAAQAHADTCSFRQ
jgi:hypothetical protein